MSTVEGDGSKGTAIFVEVLERVGMEGICRISNSKEIIDGEAVLVEERLGKESEEGSKTGVQYMG